MSVRSQLPDARVKVELTDGLKLIVGAMALFMTSLKRITSMEGCAADLGVGNRRDIRIQRFDDRVRAQGITKVLVQDGGAAARERHLVGTTGALQSARRVDIQALALRESYTCPVPVR